MENSVSRALSCNVKAMDSCEESGWTMYFQDFLAVDSQEQSSFSSGHETPSLISDAASSAAKKYCSTANQHEEQLSLEKCLKKMRCKKKKMVDDSLEDTASSPVSSPKVFALKHNEDSPNCRATRDISLEQRETPGQINERNSLAFVGRDGDSTDLKKRGLCLVPVSMMADYIG